MPSIKTVVFADLTGSVGLFESLGSARATETITQLTQWIGSQYEHHGGTAVKMLGDGVLALFDHAGDAVEAVVGIQRQHKHRLSSWQSAHLPGIKVGMALGEVRDSEGEWYGDPINTASRLSDMASAAEIWTTGQVVQGMQPPAGCHFRAIGPIVVRGRTEPVELVRIEWDEELPSEFLTVPATLEQRQALNKPHPGGRVVLRWDGLERSYSAAQMPVHIGRSPDTDFPVPHPRVSRLHARLNWRDGAFVLIDVSSYGCWVRFEGSDTVVPLRRMECTVTGSGEVALGAPFSQADVPTIRFELQPTGTYDPQLDHDTLT